MDENSSLFNAMPNDTSDVNVTEYVPYYLRPETYIVPIIFSVIFIVGAIGNGTLIFMFLSNKALRNVPNTLIFSLAVGDLCVLFLSMPFVSTIYVMDSWPFGLFICKFSEFFRNVSVGVTVFTLTALSGERYFAIISPFRKATNSSKLTMTIAVGIWVLAAVLSLPDSITSILLEISVNSGKVISICYPFPGWLPPWYTKANILTKFLVFYLIPLCVIATFYILMARSLLDSSDKIPGELHGIRAQLKTRKKLARIVLVFVCIFAICFSFNHIFLLWFYFDPNSGSNYNMFWHALRPIGFTLTFVNSCVNPVALYCISAVFRKNFNDYLVHPLLSCSPCQRERMEDFSLSIDWENTRRVDTTQAHAAKLLPDTMMTSV